MAILITAAVVRVDKTRVVGEPGNGEGAFLRRVGQLLCFSALDRDRVNIEDAGLVIMEKDLFFVGRERGSADTYRIHELLNGVLMYSTTGSNLLFRFLFSGKLLSLHAGNKEANSNKDSE